MQPICSDVRKNWLVVVYVSDKGVRLCWAGIHKSHFIGACMLMCAEFEFEFEFEFEISLQIFNQSWDGIAERGRRNADKHQQKVNDVII